MIAELTCDTSMQKRGLGSKDFAAPILSDRGLRIPAGEVFGEVNHPGRFAGYSHTLPKGSSTSEDPGRLAAVTEAKAYEAIAEYAEPRLEVPEGFGLAQSCLGVHS